MRPYIGIVDFADFSQVRAMLEVFRGYLPAGSQRMLHIGLMMSYKTLNGLSTKWLSVFPPKEKIAEILASPETYNCLHYADYDNDPEFTKSLARAISFGGVNLNAVQLDMIWPDPVSIAEAVKLSGKQVEIILQLGKNALEIAGNDPAVVVEKLKMYEGVIHRILLDKSMGRGLGMDARGLIPFAEAIKASFPKLGLGAAGGLGPDTIHLVEPLAKMFPDLSIDAQGRLRPSGNALDPIDWTMAGNYLIKALQLLG